MSNVSTRIDFFIDLGQRGRGDLNWQGMVPSQLCYPWGTTWNRLSKQVFQTSLMARRTNVTYTMQYIYIGEINAIYRTE